MLKTLTILLISLLSTEINAQNLKLIKSVAVEEPTGVSVDKAGNVFIATFKGDIVRYDGQLKEQIEFSPPNPNATTVLEARQGLRIFTFNRDLQMFRLINRSLSLNEDYNFPPDLIGYVETATSSSDNNIWLIDQTAFSLKKYEIMSHSLVSVTPLNRLINTITEEILFCKEYQNRLFISTKNDGVLIFDNFGNYLKTYEKEKVSFFNFNRSEIYYIDGTKLIQHDLYTDRLTVTELPKSDQWLFPLIFEDKYYLFSRNQAALFAKE